MAKGKKTGGRNFPAGNSFGGRPPLPPELKAVRRLTRTEFERIANKYLWMTPAELAAVLVDPETPMLERVIVRVLSKADDEGEFGPIEWLAQRLIGKVKDQVDVSVVKPTIIERLDGSRVEMGMIQEDKENE